jgi:hypothetical protein
MALMAASNGMLGWALVMDFGIAALLGAVLMKGIRLRRALKRIEAGLSKYAKAPPVIPFVALPQETQSAIRGWYATHDWEEIDVAITAYEAALMYFRLRRAPDIPALFPRGKSATLLHIETLVEQRLMFDAQEAERAR